MNRNQEYLELTQELETMKAPGGSVLRAMARQRKARRGKLFLRPLAGLAAAFAIFVFLVNVSPTIAQACEGIPILGDLAEAVRFSRSMSEAVYNDYYQKIDQQQTVDGVTLSVDYVIVDQKNVNVFFTMESDDWNDSDDVWVSPSFRLADGVDADCFYYGGRDWTRAEFRNQDVPGALQMEAWINRTYGDAEGQHRQQIGPFAFQLKFDPQFIDQGKHYDLDRVLEIDGQRIQITGVHIYPCYMDFSYEEDPNNTLRLVDLNYCVGTDDGTQYLRSSDVTARYGIPIRVDSPFFRSCKSLTLSVTEAKWVEKDTPKIHVNLTDGTVEGEMPPRTEFVRAVYGEEGWAITLRMTGEEQYSPIHGGYYAPNGEWKDADLRVYQSDPDLPYDPNASAEDSSTELVCYWMLVVPNYSGDELWLEPVFTHESVFETPITASFELK